ncbi:hypothetical protein QZH41_008563, partial [Actinostola sp. cb2023]
KKKTCYTCRGWGHFARNCPSSTNNGREDIICNNCNGKGHIKRMCPSPRKHNKEDIETIY